MVLCSSVCAPDSASVSGGMSLGEYGTGSVKCDPTLCVTDLVISVSTCVTCCDPDFDGTSNFGKSPLDRCLLGDYYPEISDLVECVAFVEYLTCCLDSWVVGCSDCAWCLGVALRVDCGCKTDYVLADSDVDG